MTRYLQKCEAYVTDSHQDAWLALAEASAFVKKLEEDSGRCVSVIVAEIKMGEDAEYYVNLVVEFF